MKKIKLPKNKYFRISILILIPVLIVFSIASCLHTTSTKFIAKTYSLNSENYTNVDGFKYYNDDSYTSYIGIDVSSAQGEIDWEEVSESGIEFAMIRCGYRGTRNGKLIEDEYFTQNIEGALENGIEVGVYVFSSAISEDEVQEEVDIVLELIEDYDVTYPVVFDMENYVDDQDRINDLSVDEKTQLAQYFCEKIQEAGYTPMVYGNKTWLTTSINVDELSDYFIWYAGYEDQPSYDGQFLMWQYSNTATLSGIDTNVDMNIYVRE